MEKLIFLEPVLPGEIIKLKKDATSQLKENSWKLVGIRRGIFFLRDLAEETLIRARAEDVNWEEYREKRKSDQPLRF